MNVRATLLDGRAHDVDSSELAFEQAARLAVSEALKEAGPIMMEPIMRVDVSTPEAFFGTVAADLSARRGIIHSTELRHDTRVIRAHVPLAELFQYETRLRTLSQGRAGSSMEPLKYAPMPEKLQDELLKRHGH